MKFSILIPVYNVEKYLKKCLDSVLAQTFTDYEVILADDGSKDKSGAICDEYQKRYPDKIRVFHKQNEGLLLTRRFSLKQAKGEYVVFVDSDDYVSCDLLFTLNENFKRYNADMLIYNFYRFRDGEEEMTSPKIPFEDGTIFEGEGKIKLYESFAVRHTFSNMWVKAVKLSIVDVDADYMPWNVSRSEDVIQSFPLFERANKIVYLDKKLYYYRKNAGSVTARVSQKDLGNFIKVTERLYQYIVSLGLSSDTKSRFFAERMSFFFTYLRDIAKKGKSIGDNTLLLSTVSELGEREEFKKVLDGYKVEYSPKRIQGRLKAFKKAMQQKKYKKVCKKIKFSNFLGRIAGGK
ncbi:MAG: glycosyltransferase family 2 protein [Clostridia bacterium]|nr:glycosyltransferase family 2 protein [Clostridia bacterium]